MTPRRQPLQRLLAGPVEQAAQGLLDCRLSANGVTVRLTEVEAYSGHGDDPASHAHRGQTKRNAVMFGPAGYAYVYFIFGVHWCINVVCGLPGAASAVLLRAGEVVDGLDLARQRRPGARGDRELGRGPGRLTQALAIDGRYNGQTLLVDGGPLRLSRPRHALEPERIARGPRVGVAAAADVPWRFWLDNDPTVSAYRRHTPRKAKLRTRG